MVLAHVESNTGTTCQPVHAADCALCHLVQTRVTPSGAPSCIPEFATQRAALVDSQANAPVVDERSWLSFPRAPPLV
jgi:hypothetical protein